MVIKIGKTNILINSLYEFDYGLYTNFILILTSITRIIDYTLNWIITKREIKYISLYKRTDSVIYGMNLFSILIFIFLLIKIKLIKRCGIYQKN